MTEPRAYLNGDFVPLSALSVPIDDSGFMMGVTVAEQLRTFGGVLFKTEAHLARLARSLDIVGIDLGISLDELAAAAAELVRENHARLAAGDDLGLTIFVTPGTMPDLLPAPSDINPRVCMHTRPVGFASWAHKYEAGQALVVPNVMQVPNRCWPPELKVRSRVHYYLADQQARAIESGARAVLLDENGFLCEASTANVVVYFEGEGVVSPRHEKILPGISVATLADLCRELDIPFLERDITPDEAARADEIMICSTSPCVLPVVRFNRRPIADGKPGKIYRQILAAWSDHVGIDIPAQARQFARWDREFS